MSKQEKSVCPGCSRHCPIGHARCKYGQKYFDKLRRTQQEAAGSEPGKDHRARRHKWEKHVQQGGLCWTLLLRSRQIKRALRKKKTSEQKLLSSLSASEQLMLHALLEKLCSTLDENR